MMPQRKSKKVAEQLTEVRKELLDLGLRNSLLNFRQPRGKGLELSHAQSETAFRLLAKEDRSFGFQPAAPTETSHVDDLQLLSTLPKDQLETRLLATFRAARVFIEEQGVNTLFLVFGMLRWKDDNSDQFFRAPLILIPAELERTDARQRFTLRYMARI